ncbi:MAG: hypothetical protein JHC87_03385, partial [Thermoleophilaceae bacterium]|nr:hypothetical protein [Thermoleophilaceae bacterium]
DAEGQVRYTHFGEGDYDVTEQAIRSLLDEAGSKGLGKDMTEVKAEVPSNVETTPETYLGAARAQRFANGQITTGTQNFGNKRGRLDLSELRYGGRWRVTEDGATAAGPTSNLQLHFRAKKVFLVLGSTGNSPRTVRVLLDGKPVTATRAGSDVKNATATIKRQRLYRLIELPRVGDHLLELQPQAGVSGYAFTFG